ncbi:hypothetical protein DW66_2726 [Pseudomonas putida]|nr:hypothetical protein DW66_2726 [Pseudomonas putida]
MHAALITLAALTKPLAVPQNIAQARYSAYMANIAPPAPMTA